MLGGAEGHGQRRQRQRDRLPPALTPSSGDDHARPRALAGSAAARRTRREAFGEQLGHRAGPVGCYRRPPGHRLQRVTSAGELTVRLEGAEPSDQRSEVGCRCRPFATQRREGAAGSALSGARLQLSGAASRQGQRVELHLAVPRQQDLGRRQLFDGEALLAAGQILEAAQHLAGDDERCISRYRSGGQQVGEADAGHRISDHEQAPLAIALEIEHPGDVGVRQALTGQGARDVFLLDRR